MADDLEAFPARVAPQAQRPPEVGTVARCRRWLRAGFDGGTAEEPGSQILARLVIFVILAGSLLAMLETEASLWHDAAVASAFQRSAGRRAGQECVRTCRYGWWPDH